MSHFYMILDVHGELDALGEALGAIDLDAPGNRLVLLGDYLPHQGTDEGLRAWMGRCGESLGFVRRLQGERPPRVDVLAGNWEMWLVELIDRGDLGVSDALERWLRGLPYVLETDAQVLVHAGVDEGAGGHWRRASDDALLCHKWPPTFGRFGKDVVAGHVGTSRIAGVPGFHGVFWDGESHYYIDGTTEESGVLPMLCYDVSSGAYDHALATRDGVGSWLPVEPMEPAGLWG